MRMISQSLGNVVEFVDLKEHMSIVMVTWGTCYNHSYIEVKKKCG